MPKHKKEIVFFTAILILYLATRLVNLKIIPVFTDESIYMFWAQTALNDPANRFISLEDGKQPLFIWIAAAVANFVKDPLIALRLVSVGSGLLSTIGIYLLASNMFNSKVAKVASVLYVLLPFTLLYDRLGIYDSLLTMLGIWAVYLTVKLAKNPQLSYAHLTGNVIGLAMITKSSGNFFQYLLPFSILLFDLKEKKGKLLKWILYIILSFIISTVIFNALRLSQFFYIIARKNIEFIRPFGEVLNDPFLHFYSNLNALAGWFVTYTGIPLSIIFVAGLLFGVYKKDKRVLYLAVLIFAPFVAKLFFNKVLYARFMLFYYPYVLLVISYAFITLLEKYKNLRNLLIPLFAAAIVLPAITSIRLITSPTEARIPQNDADQYLNEWPAGYGVSEVVGVLKTESQNKKVVIGTEGTFGIYPYVLNVYFYKNDNVRVIGYWPLDPNQIPSEILESVKTTKTFLVFNFTQKEISNSKLKFINSYKKGVGNSYMRLYEVLP